MLRQDYIIFTLIWMVAGCRTDVDLIAPEARERIMVYAILKAHDSVQYVRLGRLFVTQEDAAAYAARTDLNVAARVKIIDLRDTSRQGVGVPETVLKVPDQLFPDVFVQAPLIVLDDDRNRQVHGRDKAEPFLDARFFHLGSHQRRQVHNVPPPRRLHPQISRMRTHWTKMRESPVKSQSQTPEGHHKK
jgi:hypothetical protein